MHMTIPFSHSTLALCNSIQVLGYFYAGFLLVEAVIYAIIATRTQLAATFGGSWSVSGWVMLLSEHEGGGGYIMVGAAD